MRNTQEILRFLREEVNEKNIDEVISTFTQKLNEEGKDADYFVYTDSQRWKLSIGENNKGSGISSDQCFIAENIKLKIIKTFMSLIYGEKMNFYGY
ncbi:MAG: hypothetical protein IKK43_02265 [Clostridia bacterium]|nr:hypothetical protein [Clostridia bacterium]